jgi:cell division protein FtsB
MRKEELDRRSAELKARMLAQRNGYTQEKPSTVTERKFATKARQRDDSFTVKSSDGDDVEALKKRIAQLEAENESLRQRLTLTSTRLGEPSRSSEDSVREQRHNFLKYSNLRRH